MIEQYILDHQLNAMRIAGRRLGAGRKGDRAIEVFKPYTAQVIGAVPKATLDLGYEEGVQEAMKSFTKLKTYSQPWP